MSNNVFVDQIRTLFLVEYSRNIQEFSNNEANLLHTQNINLNLLQSLEVEVHPQHYKDLIEIIQSPTFSTTRDYLSDLLLLGKIFWTLNNRPSELKRIIEDFQNISDRTFANKLESIFAKSFAFNCLTNTDNPEDFKKFLECVKLMKNQEAKEFLKETLESEIFIQFLKVNNDLPRISSWLKHLGALDHQIIGNFTELFSRLLKRLKISYDNNLEEDFSLSDEIIENFREILKFNNREDETNFWKDETKEILIEFTQINIASFDELENFHHKETLYYEATTKRKKPCIMRMFNENNMQSFNQQKNIMEKMRGDNEFIQIYGSFFINMNQEIKDKLGCLYKNYYCLIIENIISLGNFLNNKRGIREFDWENFTVKIGIKLIQAFERLYNQRISHLNINTESILICERNFEYLPKITGLEFSKETNSDMRDRSVKINARIHNGEENYIDHFLLKLNKEYTIPTEYAFNHNRADVFSLGLVLIKCARPDINIEEINTETNGLQRQIAENLIDSFNNEDLKFLLRQMIMPDIDNRPSFQDLAESIRKRLEEIPWWENNYFK